MKRSEKKTESRELILKSAYELFSKYGILQTSTQQIAEFAGMSHGNIFAHFSNRNLLVLAVIDQFGKKLAEALNASAAKSQSILELLKCHLDILTDFEAFYTFLVIEGPLLPKELNIAVFSIQSGIASFLDTALKAEKKQIPLPMLLNAWLGYIHYHLINRELFTEGTSVLQTHRKTILDFIKRLIR